MVTRLSYIHPYPAMIADPLALELAKDFVAPGMRMLDPFCGTGRTLLAGAQNGADCFGVDVNPLACLLVKVKSAAYCTSEINDFLKEMESVSSAGPVPDHFDFERNRKVAWFSEKTKEGLSELITIINSRKRNRTLIFLAAALLSATAREVSYCRNDRWKLHRIPATARAEVGQPARAVFVRRLRSAANEISKLPLLPGSCRSFTGDSKDLRAIFDSRMACRLFDVVITSPPYGDSRTTVEYGGISSICLGVISYIHGLENLYMPGKEIDGRCLGGKLTLKSDLLKNGDSYFSEYWRGSSENKGALRVFQYLSDLERVWMVLGSLIRSGGRLILVVGRRSVGNRRVYVDRFTEDVCKKLDFELEHRRKRIIKNKMLSTQINRYARAKSTKRYSRSNIPTMSEEIVLIFRKR